MTVKDDATQQGAPADESQAAAQEEQQQQFRSPRDEAMERMAQNRRATLAAEGVEIEQEERRSSEDESSAEGADKQEQGQKQGEQRQEEDLSADAQVAQQTDPTVIADGFDKVKVRAKIDGEEVEVSLDQVLRQFQKNGAADRRLAEATKILNEAKERATAPNDANDEKQQEEPGRADEKAPGTKELAEKAVAALMEGNEAEVATIFDEVMNGRQQQVPAIPSVEEITQSVKQQIEVESALRQFSTDYADIDSDPYLSVLAIQAVQQKVQEGTSFPDALRETGEDLRGWIKGKSGAATDEPATTAARNERLERKARLDNVRAASVTAKSSTTQEPLTEEQIRREAMEELRKSRVAQG
ncbi:hypothetical protein [Pseudothauera rhizosphaerae]|uniref:Uncharacterized protein n=1 Tax=Pseudothauera rhizosphaerae TaxID=2565932 RepID=A0A4S4AAL7_9RHOO|nr:hypothetical protein [Pseudothauera rhizosphaerae]THF55922.1 hypothetical protein E6O51_20260 [Pseudothauera rhizosphaerae]